MREDAISELDQSSIDGPSRDRPPSDRVGDAAQSDTGALGADEDRVEIVWKKQNRATARDQAGRRALRRH